MNFLAGSASAAFAFVFMMAMTTFIMGKGMDEAVLYSLVAAATLFVVFGFMARDISADVKGATAQQAANVVGAKFKIGLAPLPGGRLQLTGGANFFWAPVIVTPTSTGVTLRGPANIVTFIKTALEKT